MLRQLGWLGIYLVIALVLFFLLPFPIDMILLFGLIVLITYFRRMMIMRRHSGKGRKRDLFGLFTSSTSESQRRQLKYFCMSCGKQHNDVECPICGSKMKKVGEC
jgi:uncharacterized paraquat-inducible protein A